MGRRIYEDGNFVWKYSFGRQDSEMRRFSDEFGIGNYYEETDYLCDMNKKDLSKLKELLNKISNGKTRDELNLIGMKAVNDFISVQSEEWKKAFEEELEKVKTYKSEKDFGFGGSYRSGHRFEIYDIFAKAIEKYIADTFDFYAMTERFIDYIEKSKKEILTFEDEL